jgi:hypothetical protein
MPRKIFVLINANVSKPFEIFVAKICVAIKTNTTNITKISIEKYPIVDVMMKNQKDTPAVTANDLNLGEDVSILYRINE